MPALPLHPVPAPRETVFSFLSRFAAMNAATATDFSIDLGFRMRRFIQLEQVALERLCETADLDRRALNDLISWTGQPVGDAWTELRNERFSSKAARNPIMRGCPICLREDAQANPNDPVSVMVMRGDWLLRDVSICCRHQHHLVPLWEEIRPERRFDSVTFLRNLAPRIIAGELDQPRRAPSPYDLWLDARLATGQDPTWLAGYSLFAATTICGLLGELLIPEHAQEGPGPSNLQAEAHAAGFEVLAKGEAELRTILKSLAEAATSNWTSMRGAFGKLHDALAKYLTDDGFDPFRQILRDCILETWPFAAGEVVLGEVVQTRLLHTPTTAANETGLSKQLMEFCLIEVGAIPENDPRPPALRTFSAQKYDSFLNELPTLVVAKEMMATIGCTAVQLRALSDGAVLSPVIRHPKVRSSWRISDGVALLAELNELAIPLTTPAKKWESIQLASQRSGISVGELIAAIRIKRLQLGRNTDLVGYRSYVVMRAEVDHMAGDQPHRRRRAETIPSGELASTYALKVGIKARHWFLRLFEAGHVSARWVPHPVTGANILYLTDDDIAAFHRRFMTPMTMQAEFGLHGRTCVARLNAAKVSAFSPDGQDFGALYERPDVEAVLRKGNP